MSKMVYGKILALIGTLAGSAIGMIFFGIQGFIPSVIVGYLIGVGIAIKLGWRD